MNTTQITALSIGLCIFAFATLFLVYFSFYTNKSTFSKGTIFSMKKWSYIAFVLFFNAAMCVLVYYLQNVQVIVYVILALKSKDLISSLIFVPRIVYKHLYEKIQEPRQAELSDINLNKNIVAFIPAYKETTEQLLKTVNSVLSNNVSPNYLLTCVVSDGVNSYKDILDELLISKSNVYYKSWRGNSVCTDVYFGTLSGRHILLIEKTENVGKKDSIILVNAIFNSSSNLDEYTKEITSILLSTFGSNKFNYMFVTDADTRIESNTIRALISSVENRNATASCAIVQVERESGNWFWNNLQNFQYVYGQYMRRTTEDLFGQVLCLPGCVSLICMNEAVKTAGILYSYIPDEDDLIASSVQYVGTDRRYTGSLLYTDPNVKTVMSVNSNAYTIPPQTFTSYVSQRRRWCQNTYFNTMINIVAPNINLLLRFFCFIDYLRLTLVYFRLFNTTFFIYLLAVHFKPSEILDLVPYLVVLIYPTLFFFVYSLFNNNLRAQWLNLFVSYLVNKIFIVFSNIIIFTIMLFNIGYDSWTQIQSSV